MADVKIVPFTESFQQSWLTLVIVGGYGGTGSQPVPGTFTMTDTFPHGYALLIGFGQSAYPKWSLPLTVKNIQALQKSWFDVKINDFAIALLRGIKGFPVDGWDAVKDNATGQSQIQVMTSAATLLAAGFGIHNSTVIKGNGNISIGSARNINLPNQSGV